MLLLFLLLSSSLTVDRVFIFVCDGHGHSQADSSLQCWIRVCARVEGLQFWCWPRYSWIRPVQFGLCFRMLSMALIVFVAVSHSVAWVVVMLYESPRW